MYVCMCFVLLSRMFKQGADVDSLISLTTSIRAITVTLIEHATDLFTNLEVTVCLLLCSCRNLTSLLCSQQRLRRNLLRNHRVTFD